jgi:hypothetical protein
VSSLACIRCSAAAMSTKSPAASQRTREGQGNRFCAWCKHGLAASYPIDQYAIIYRIRDGDVLIVHVNVHGMEPANIALAAGEVSSLLIFVFYSPLSYNLVHRHMKYFRGPVLAPVCGKGSFATNRSVSM